MTAYLYIYNNWRIYELPWDSAATWFVAAILCDLGYYWVHRAAHGKLFSLFLYEYIYMRWPLRNFYTFNRLVDSYRNKISEWAVGFRYGKFTSKN